MDRVSISLRMIQRGFEVIQKVYAPLKTLCERVWQIGNYLNQKTPNYGAAGFIFNDLVRILLMTGDEGAVKTSVIDVIVGNFPELKEDLSKIVDLKNFILEARLVSACCFLRFCLILFTFLASLFLTKYLGLLMQRQRKSKNCKIASLTLKSNLI